MVVIALSGPDNVGKSTQLRLLVRRGGFVDAGPLDAYDGRWIPARAGGLADWWFDSAPVAEVVDVLARSYLARSAAHHSPAVGATSGARCVADRGIPMLEATVVATVTVREHRSRQSAAGRAAELLAPYRPELDHAEAAELGVLMLHGDDPGASVARTLSREREASARYAIYQQALHSHLHHLAANGRFDHIAVVADQPILAVHQHLVTWLSQRQIEVPPSALADVDVVALGGLSESGKSTAGAYLQNRHGFARLKIGYLLETAAARHGVADIYGQDAVALAELLIAGLDDYCAAHHFQRRLSIESLHRAGQATELAKLLGDCLRVVFLDTAQPTREARGEHGPQDVRDRDAVKTNRGAADVRGLAHVVLDNNGPRLALYHALDRLVADIRWPRRRPPACTAVADLRLPDHLGAYLDALLSRLTAAGRPLALMLAVTGSGARGKYQHGWSDLDVLIIAETDQLTDLRDVLSAVAGELRGVKLGCTVISPAECYAGALTPRLLHTLRQITSGQLPVLCAAEGLRLPQPDADTDAVTSLRDGVAAAVEIRRQLLRQTVDHRSLFKVTAMLAKVALRADGHEHADDINALRALIAADPDRFGPADTADRARHEPITTAALAADVLRWWLATLPAATPDRRATP